MSGNRHPDLDRFYEALEAEGGDGEFYPDPDDEDGDGDFDVYLDEIDEDDVDDDGMIVDVDVPSDEEDEEDDEDDDDFMIDVEEDDEDEGDGEIRLSGQTWLNLAELINSSRGSAGARSSLLAQLLAAPNVRAGGAGLRRMPEELPTDPVERARRLAERRRKERWWKPQSEPNPRGLQLLQSGEFGRVGPWRRATKGARVPVRHQQLRSRAQATVPNTNGTIVASYPSIPYVGQYAGEDYSLFYCANRRNRDLPSDAATQYYTLHLYNTSQTKAAPRRPKPSKEEMATAGQTAFTSRVQREDDDEDDDVEHYPWGGGYRRPRGMTEDSSMRKIKNVQGVEGNWTITDCDADKKAEKMIYSSITPYVHMLYTAEDDTDHVLLDFSSHRRGRYIMEDDVSSIWSIRFSADGKEVVAGAGRGKIMVYDIEAQTRSLSVSGHADDVNAVSFADESSTNILVSGSDDGYVKIWDRRSLSSSTPSGVLVGATEGITYTSPKGDGRYLVVNSKDQAARLYDLRKMRSWSEFDGEYDAVSKYGQAHYDYRNSRYPAPSRLAHPKDCSVMTYRGHSVLRTLIRCHFSPRESTGQNYIYSGSADGMIHIWSLDGRVVQVLNRAQSLPLKRSARPGDYTDPSAPEPSHPTPRYSAMPGERGQSWTVRDVSWHGFEPTLMSTCWEVDGGYRRGGTLAKHEWKGLGKGGLRRLEDWVEKEVAEGDLAGVEADL